jgi:hypothetical protein
MGSTASLSEVEDWSPTVTIDHLYQTRCAAVPDDAGVYVVMLENPTARRFLRRGTGGWYQGRDPDHSLDDVRASWVPNAKILYIGKAAGRRGLKQRLRQLVDFGHGRPVAHRGGRMLWQVADSGTLLVRWLALPANEARAVEQRLISEFTTAHGGRRPFANKVG